MNVRPKQMFYPEEVTLLRKLERQLSAHFITSDLGHLEQAQATLVELTEWRKLRPGEPGGRAGATQPQGGTLP